MASWTLAAAYQKSRIYRWESTVEAGFDKELMEVRRMVEVIEEQTGSREVGHEDVVVFSENMF